jgi:hypothetical protein
VARPERPDLAITPYSIILRLVLIAAVWIYAVCTWPSGLMVALVVTAMIVLSFAGRVLSVLIVRWGMRRRRPPGRA